MISSYLYLFDKEYMPQDTNNYNICIYSAIKIYSAISITYGYQQDVLSHFNIQIVMS